MALPDDSTFSAPAPATHDVVVRRSPRYVRFIAVGAILAILITLILTFVFPEQPDYSRAQVFGFVGIILVTLFVGLAATIAVLVDRASAKRARTISMTTSERIEARDDAADQAPTNQALTNEAPTNQALTNETPADETPADGATAS